MSVFQKIAAVLEATAAELEKAPEVPAVKQAEAQVAAPAAPALPSPVEKLAARYREVVGEELPVEVAQKFASVDGALLEVLDKVAAPSSPAPLGSPEEDNEDENPRASKHARLDAAYRRFGRFLAENA